MEKKQETQREGKTIVNLWRNEQASGEAQSEQMESDKTKMEIGRDCPGHFQPLSAAMMSFGRDSRVLRAKPVASESIDEALGSASS